MSCPTHFLFWLNETKPEKDIRTWPRLYSDGVLEAADDRGDTYGEDRLRDMLLAGAREGAGASSVLERVLWDVNRYSASAERTDDITAICIRVTD